MRRSLLESLFVILILLGALLVALAVALATLQATLAPTLTAIAAARIPEHPRNERRHGKERDTQEGSLLVTRLPREPDMDRNEHGRKHHEPEGVTVAAAVVELVEGQQVDGRNREEETKEHVRRHAHRVRAVRSPCGEQEHYSKGRRTEGRVVRPAGPAAATGDRTVIARNVAKQNNNHDRQDQEHDEHLLAYEVRERRRHRASPGHRRKCNRHGTCRSDDRRRNRRRRHLIRAKKKVIIVYSEMVALW